MEDLKGAEVPRQVATLHEVDTDGDGVSNHNQNTTGQSLARCVPNGNVKKRVEQLLDYELHFFDYTINQ